jgi:hypothetical protein
MENTKEDPGPSLADAQRWPRWASIIERLTESPIPVPSSQKIQNDLLNLDAVAFHRRQILVEFMPDHDPVVLQLAQRERDHFPRRIIQVYRLGRNFLPLEKGPQARDNLGGAIPIANRASRRFARTLDVRGIAVQHTQACAGIRHDARQRLVNFMRD